MKWCFVLFARIQQQVRKLKSDAIVLYFVYHDPRMPWYAKLFIGFVVAYALSPIDLIPDFIPVLGYLDDMIIIPAGIIIALKMIPPEVMADCRLKADAMALEDRPVSKFAGIIILSIWILVALWLAILSLQFLTGP